MHLLTKVAHTILGPSCFTSHNIILFYMAEAKICDYQVQLSLLKSQLN